TRLYSSFNLPPICSKSFIFPPHSSLASRNWTKNSQSLFISTVQPSFSPSFIPRHPLRHFNATSRPTVTHTSSRNPIILLATSHPQRCIPSTTSSHTSTLIHVRSLFSSPPSRNPRRYPFPSPRGFYSGGLTPKQVIYAILGVNVLVFIMWHT